jgi:plasmid stability protein
MANLTIHNLDESIAKNLYALAQQHGQSIEEEVRHILHRAILDKSPQTSGLGSRIAKRFMDIGGVELPQPSRSLPRQAANFGEAN